MSCFSFSACFMSWAWLICLCCAFEILQSKFIFFSLSSLYSSYMSMHALNDMSMLLFIHFCIPSGVFSIFYKTSLAYTCYYKGTVPRLMSRRCGKKTWDAFDMTLSPLLKTSVSYFLFWVSLTGLVVLFPRFFLVWELLPEGASMKLQLLLFYYFWPSFGISCCSQCYSYIETTSTNSYVNAF